MGARSTEIHTEVACKRVSKHIQLGICIEPFVVHGARRVKRLKDFIYLLENRMVLHDKSEVCSQL